MLIETSWITPHDVSTYRFRAVESTTSGPDILVLSEDQFNLWLAVRGLRPTANRDENLQKPKVLLPLDQIAEPQPVDFTIWIAEFEGSIYLKAASEQLEERCFLYQPAAACLEWTMLIGTSTVVDSQAAVEGLEWLQLFHYEAKAKKISSSTMPSSMPQCRQAQTELKTKKHMPLWFPRALCISLNM